MKGEKVLITGGAGFIGSHLADRLLETGHSVRVLDCLVPQVHAQGPPAYLSPEVELRVGDVRDASAVEAALDGVSTVVHLAAEVGVGQSMYEITRYTSSNVLGTAVLLEAIVKRRMPLRRLVVASSMSAYGEGLYHCPSCGPQTPGPRPVAQLARHEWEMCCPTCGGAMQSRPTPESKAFAPTSVYAINKRDQEEMVLTVARSIGVSALALRLFNTYGPRQALSNPYTGVVAIFSAALLSKRPPKVFEDGRQARDFVHVSDVAEAFRLAVLRDDVADMALNVGTGQATNLLELIQVLERLISASSPLEREIVGHFREGDIRACYADISRIRTSLGFDPRVPLAQGLRLQAEWVVQQTGVRSSDSALDELRQHGLIR